MRYLLIFLLFFSFSDFLFSARIKRVLILDIKNIEENPNYNYLENSITDAIRNLLKKKFAFYEMPKEKWQSIAEENYVYPEDYYTRTSAMNVGLLTKQDIVIAGEFKP
ncbi:MAG: hypothetical protein D6767_05500 [Candidatus Hydrogenedentota bacterium]|nr:MAG: hypothetical protein D6767_05500 [Candidatus Hydrogenedentota bacterium]